MSSCRLYKDGRDTAGNPIYKVKCYCGTTVCKRLDELNLVTCDHMWSKCGDELDDNSIEHCIACGKHRKRGVLQEGIKQ